jgi:hypothetical protein
VVLEANSLAIQIHGGYGYTRDFPVEQYWRDNRLNMIHEGTHGIQAMDLLGRKVRMEGGRGLALLAARVQATIEKAQAHDGLHRDAAALAAALERIGQVTRRLGRRRRQRGAGQRRALHAGLRPRGAGVDLAGRGAGCDCYKIEADRAGLMGAKPIFSLRIAQDRRLAARGGKPRHDLRRIAEEAF